MEDDDETRDLSESPWDRIGRFLRRVPRQDRARSVVSAILDAAEERIEVIADGPLQALFKRAGVAAGSFYEYFATRDDLLGTVVERVTDRNFETILRDIDHETGGDAALEKATYGAARVVVAHYLRHPSHYRAVGRIIDRLGLGGYVVRERDRFADAVAVRAARFLPEVSPEGRSVMMRAVADAVTGIVFVAAFRAPPPPTDEVAQLAGDVAWGVVRAHLERARVSIERADS